MEPCAYLIDEQLWSVQAGMDWPSGIPGAMPGSRQEMSSQRCRLTDRGSVVQPVRW